MICSALIRQQYMLLNNYKGQKEEWVMLLLLSRHVFVFLSWQLKVSIKP